MDQHGALGAEDSACGGVGVRLGLRGLFKYRPLLLWFAGTRPPYGNAGRGWGVEGGAEGRGGEDGGWGREGGGSDTARSAAVLGQSTRTGGSSDSGATHPQLQHPPSQEATKPWALGVSHSAHTAVLVKAKREIRNRKDYREIRDKRCTSLCPSSHSARAHASVHTCMLRQQYIPHSLLLPSKYMHRHSMPCNVARVFVLIQHKSGQVCAKKPRQEQTATHNWIAAKLGHSACWIDSFGLVPPTPAGIL